MSSYTDSANPTPGIFSQEVHNSRTQIASSSPANSSSRSFKSYYFARRIILGVIGLAVITMILFTLFNLIATSEYLVKRRIKSIASDYYENYYYNLVLSFNENHGDIDQVFAHYQNSGFAKVTLRQLLLYDNQKHIGAMSELSKYCNLDSTIIKVYPEPPFSKTNYHINYGYSCKF